MGDTGLLLVSCPFRKSFVFVQCSMFFPTRVHCFAKGCGTGISSNGMPRHLWRRPFVSYTCTRYVVGPRLDFPSPALAQAMRRTTPLICTHFLTLQWLLLTCSGRSRRNSLVQGQGTLSGLPPLLSVSQRGLSAALENATRTASAVRRTSTDGGQVRTHRVGVTPTNDIMHACQLELPRARYSAGTLLQASQVGVTNPGAIRL